MRNEILRHKKLARKRKLHRDYERRNNANIELTQSKKHRLSVFEILRRKIAIKNTFQTVTGK